MWLRRDQGSLVLSWCGCGKSCGQDMGIAAKFILRLWCFAIACAAMRNAGVLVFCKKNFVRPTGETGMRGGLSRTKKRKPTKKGHQKITVVQVTAEKKKYNFVKHNVCLVTCLHAYIYVAYSVLSLCFVVSYSDFFN